MLREKLNPFNHAVCLDYPLWLEETAWAEHIPFAMFLVSLFKPKVLVELGTYRGVSYCAFCQAVKNLRIDAKCYAVDTWEGDGHTGKLEESILTKLRGHHDPLYTDFSRLLQSTFDDALKNFDNGSIDLLHIDGFHNYEAVSHDFKSWLPKLSDRGIVLFHDINVRESDFGVWKLWAEVKNDHLHFEFLHSHGLGILAVGKNLSPEMQSFFAANEKETVLIRKLFHALGERFGAVRMVQAQAAYIDRLKTYERIVSNSRLLRAYRVLKDEGIAGILKRRKKTTAGVAL